MEGDRVGIQPRIPCPHNVSHTIECGGGENRWKFHRIGISGDRMERESGAVEEESLAGLMSFGGID